LWNAVPRDNFVLLLGGHTFLNQTKSEDGQFISSDQSYGSYGFAVSNDNLSVLRQRWLYDAEHPIAYPGGFIVSPDLSWYTEAKLRREKIYATNPLLVWHEEGFSNTWNRTRGAIHRPQ
jgi:hypothetical protein